jgi:hypothetical protein
VPVQADLSSRRSSWNIVGGSVWKPDDEFDLELVVASSGTECFTT